MQMTPMHLRQPLKLNASLPAGLPAALNSILRCKQEAGAGAGAGTGRPADLPVEDLAAGLLAMHGRVVPLGGSAGAGDGESPRFPVTVDGATTQVPLSAVALFLASKSGCSFVLHVLKMTKGQEGRTLAQWFRFAVSADAPTGGACGALESDASFRKIIYLGVLPGGNVTRLRLLKRFFLIKK